MYIFDTYRGRKILKNRFMVDLKEFNYWMKVRKRFKARAKLGQESFEMQFKHDIKSDIVYDDEFRIEAFADAFGYEIVDEEIRFDRSIYVFKKKQK